MIQKMMSAPVLAGNEEVLGVIQVSRKAPRPAAAGPDFTAEDLRKLEAVGRLCGNTDGQGQGLFARERRLVTHEPH